MSRIHPPHRRQPALPCSSAPRALAACGANDAQTGGDSGSGGGDEQGHRAAAARVQDHPLRDLRQAALRGQGRRALRATARSSTTTPTRTRPSRPSRSTPRSPRAPSVVVLDPVNGAGAGGMVQSRPGLRRPGHRLRPVHRGGRLLHVLRQRDGRQDAGRGARRGDGRQGQHPDAQRRPERPQRRAVQGRRPQRARRERREDPRGVRQPRLEPGERPDSSSPTSSSKYDAVRDQGRLRRQRRPGRRRRRRPDRWRRRRGRPAADHRPGRRARRHPADPRRRAGDDDLQADPDRGRDRRRGRRRSWPTARTSATTSDTGIDQSDYEGVTSYIFTRSS